MGHDITTRMGATMPVWAIEGETPEEGEWPKRDAVPFVADDPLAQTKRDLMALIPEVYGPIGQRPAEVTPEMEQSGHDVKRTYGSCAAIYRAMAALAPVPLVSDAEIALTKERDQLRARNAVLERTIADYADADAARINAAALAALSLKPVVPVPEVFDPIANAIRTHETDRRMISR